MKYALHITAAAERDINDAADYIEFVLMNPQASVDLLDAIDAAVSSLSEHPLRIKPISDAVLSAWGIRFFRVKNYLAFFTVDEDACRVNIVRFLYMTRDWMGILREGLL